MANKHRGATEVDLGDGVKRRVRFTMNAVEALEEHFGGPVQTVFVQDKINVMRVADYKKMILVGLNGGGDKEITEEEIGDIIDFAEFPTLMEIIMGALMKSSKGAIPSGDKSKPGGEKEEDPTSAQTEGAGTGTS